MPPSFKLSGNGIAARIFLMVRTILLRLKKSKQNLAIRPFGK
jgi:hypothetical protein